MLDWLKTRFEAVALPRQTKVRPHEVCESTEYIVWLCSTYTCYDIGVFILQMLFNQMKAKYLYSIYYIKRLVVLSLQFPP